MLQLVINILKALAGTVIAFLFGYTWTVATIGAIRFLHTMTNDNTAGWFSYCVIIIVMATTVYVTLPILATWIRKNLL